MERFLSSSWNIHTLQFLSVEALFLLDGGTLSKNIINCGAFVLDLNRTFSSWNLFLNLSLSNLTSSLLSVGAGLPLDISALLPGHGLEDGLGHLVADLLGDLTTHRLG